MRTMIILYLSILFSTLNANDDLVSSIDQTLQKVINISNNKAHKAVKVDYDPFKEAVVTTPKIEETVEESTPEIATPTVKKLELSMIFNQKALIDGVWYKENEKISDYRIKKIDKDIVTLSKNNKNTILRLPSSKQVLVVSEENK